MPVEAKLQHGKVRIVESESGNVQRAKRADGTPGRDADGGGRPNTPAGWAKAGKQVSYINEGIAQGEAKKNFAKSFPNKPLSAAPRKSESPATGPKVQSPM